MGLDGEMKIAIKPQHVCRENRQHSHDSIEQNLNGPTEKPLWDLANQASHPVW
jgi:hypothetical protein